MLGTLALLVALSGPPPSTYDASATAAQICTPGFSRRRRHVTYATRDKVYNRDGYPRHHRQGLVIDHLEPLEIGGTNSMSNLFAQPRTEAHRKDDDENAAREYVCSGRMTPQQARIWIWNRWKR